MTRWPRVTLVLAALVAAAVEALAQAPVSYRLTFPEREHRLMDVEVTFSDVPEGPLQLRMSRTSPGRYALHEFAKNVFGVRATRPDGSALAVTRPNPHQWDVAGHDGTVRVTYRVFGDRVDGTYLAIDTTHAHINMPAALMWARGFELRPAVVRFEVPPDSGWRVATQLLPGPDAFTFTAPNLQYLMDSPSEASAFTLRTFTVDDGSRQPTIRLAVHHEGTEADVDGLARDVERIVREMRHVFGEYPDFEGNTYTFIADYLPWAAGDAMEHRNSTILTSAQSIRSGRLDLLDSAAHEFFHAWNVERIRPRSLEPFNFEEAGMSGELWLAEGFTNYYSPLVLVRSGITGLRDFAQEMGRAINTVLTGPGRAVRTAEEMSQLAPFVDAAAAIDRTNFENTYLSYYTWGSVIGLGLDLTLRDRSDGAVTLDHFMRRLWERHGKPGGSLPGHVDAPYTMEDVESALADVAGDAAFAAQFISRYVRGHEVMDLEPLLARAGLVLRRVGAGRAYAGSLRLSGGPGGARITAPVPFGSPAYEGGLERDDVLVSLAGQPIASSADLTRVLEGRAPRDRIPVVFDRRGQRVSSMMTLAEDPHYDLVPAEDVGRTVTAAERRFREEWLGSRGR